MAHLNTKYFGPESLLVCVLEPNFVPFIQYVAVGYCVLDGGGDVTVPFVPAIFSNSYTLFYLVLPQMFYLVLPQMSYLVLPLFYLVLLGFSSLT